MMNILNALLLVSILLLLYLNYALPKESYISNLSSPKSPFQTYKFQIFGYNYQHVPVMTINGQTLMPAQNSRRSDFMVYTLTYKDRFLAPLCANNIMLITSDDVEPEVIECNSQTKFKLIKVGTDSENDETVWQLKCQ